MSLQGIKMFADALSNLQTVRGKLLGSGNNQDIRLGQLLEDAKDAVKHQFTLITLEEE